MKQPEIVLQGTATGSSFDGMRRRVRLLTPGEILTIEFHSDEGVEIPQMFREIFRRGSIVVSAWKERGVIDQNCGRRNPMPMLIMNPGQVMTSDARDALLAYKRSGKTPPMLFAIEAGSHGLEDLWGPRFHQMVVGQKIPWPKMSERSTSNWQKVFIAACNGVNVSKEALDALTSCRSSLKLSPNFSAKRLIALAQKAVAAATNNGKSEGVIEPMHIIAAWSLSAGQLTAG